MWIMFRNIFYPRYLTQFQFFPIYQLPNFFGFETFVEQVDLEKFVQSRDELSGADIKAVCTEAGMLALRERRMKVCQEDFVKAKEKALYRKKGNIPEGLYL